MAVLRDGAVRRKESVDPAAGVDYPTFILHLLLRSVHGRRLFPAVGMQTCSWDGPPAPFGVSESGPPETLGKDSGEGAVLPQGPQRLLELVREWGLGLNNLARARVLQPQPIRVQ